jgi:hypothetical protein
MTTDLQIDARLTGDSAVCSTVLFCPPVAVLCAQLNSVYHDIEGLEVYDINRDARTFSGGMPVIAHPPCRSWSAHCAHQAKPAPGERELGLWCVDQVKRWGGVLEQPANSRLWDAARLPKPGWTHTRDLWAMEVWQAWWGYPMRKATWLLFSQICPMTVRTPLQLHPRGCDRRREQLMSKNERSKTTPEFARWLVMTARQVGQNDRTQARGTPGQQKQTGATPRRLE